MTSPTTLSDGVKAAILYHFNTIHTSFPAIIVSYDYATQKASVQPALNKIYTNGDVVSMPILSDVPVIFPRSGGASLTFPVNVDDTVLIVCSERSMDSWLNQGGQVTPNDPRKFDLSDAIAIIGLYPFFVSSPATNNTDTTLQYKNSKIIIDSSGNVKIETASTIAIGNATTELLNVVSQILGYLTSVTAINVPSTPYIGALDCAAAAAILQTQLNAIKGIIP